jgi:polyhydroxyalkanoate synthesis regulator phasin
MSLPILREHADTVRLFDPATGEEVDLESASLDTLAELRDLIREHEENQRLAKQQLDAEIHERLDRENTLTARVGEWLITGKAAETTEWNTEALATILEELVDDGKLSEDAAKRALEPVLTLKPRPGELKKLADKFTEIRACAHRVPQIRRATIKRAA